MHIQSERFSRSLPVRFTPDELRTKADEMAEKYARVQALEDEKKQVASDYKGRIDVLSSEVATLSRHISQKQEYQQVPCFAYLDWPKYGEKTIVRTDTNETVSVETMGPADRQLAIQFERDTDPNSVNPLETPQAEAVEQPIDVPIPDDFRAEPASIDDGVLEHDGGGQDHEAPGEDDEPKSLLDELGQA